MLNDVRLLAFNKERTYSLSHVVSMLLFQVQRETLVLPSLASASDTGALRQSYVHSHRKLIIEMLWQSSVFFTNILTWLVL